MRLHDRATGAYTARGVYATKADADAALAAAKADKGRGGFVAPDRGRILLCDYADRWLSNHTALDRPHARRRELAWLPANARSSAHLVERRRFTDWFWG